MDEVLAQGGASPGQANNAFDFLPDGLQGLAQGHADPSAFWADVSRLKAMDRELTALSGVTPETLAKPEDFDRAFAALGRPENKDGYKLPQTWEGALWTPEGPSDAKPSAATTEAVSKMLADPNEQAQFRDMARRCDLTQKQAEKLYNFYGSVLARHVEAEQATRTDPRQAVQELWPEDTAAHLDTARRGARALGIGDDLDAAGLSGNPLVLKLAYALGERLGEDTPAGMGGGGGGGALPTGQAAREELHRVVASEAYKTHDPAAIKRAQALSERAQMR
jgi:hypothetical protein